ncbi:endonuclease/exonuclease/phosphatase family protein [uncultured Dokdonia sp.]|uniref:endonuclease/exonuclease/phosphatase family protein n=1 Tax=uncultured Dokdonia sp. TaxID=575653 RepID=UPI002624AC8C|nr:endonuclease/exonuclease/phosphatase family protein [uncultured Dokdonia sp.]
MKGLSFFGKAIFFFNSIFAILLVLGYALPYIPPHIFPKLSVLSLLLPVLLLVNAVFLIYWVLRGKRQLFLSAFVLITGIGHISSLYHFGDNSNATNGEGLKILSYNVRSFNLNGWSKQKNIGERIIEFVTKKDPDIVCFQEYNPEHTLTTQQYPYRYRKMIGNSNLFGQIIYSKFPIVHTGSLDFDDTGNNAIFADVVIDNDTIRIYNVHFQSLRVSSKFNTLKDEDSKRLLGRMGEAFKKQEEQVMVFLKSEQKSPYPVIVAGDFNNSSTSYMYRKIRGVKQDAYEKAGTGTGRSFTFDFIPLRIDFILADPKFEILQFENYDIKLSDHYPIESVINKSFKF